MITGLHHDRAVHQRAWLDRAQRNATGEILLTIVSDDNFSAIQRTIRLQFALVGE
jgi:hypothetical protein